MKSRFIIIVISLIAFLVTAGASYFTYVNLNNNTEEQIEMLAEEELADIDRHVSGYISSNHVAVKNLAENKSIRQFLINEQSESEIASADVVLDSFYKATDSSVVYLMNKDGLTIASSNRHSPGSFVGKHYGFRPYFTQAIAGKPSVYLALGKTSGIRGIYFSQPIFGSSTENPVGVAIIKYPISRITDWFIDKNFSGDIFLHDPQGVIFVSNVQDSLYKTLWKLSAEQIADIVTSNQFGTGPFEWSGLKRIDERQIVDIEGKLFVTHQKVIAALPGWGLILIHSHESIIQSIYGQMFQFWRYILLTIVVMVGLVVLFLYRIGSDSLIRLQQTEEKYRTLFESSRDAIMTLAPPTWNFTSGNPATMEMFKVTDKAHFITLGPWEFSPEIQPDGKPSGEKAKEMIETAMRNGSHFFEWMHCSIDGTPFPAEVLLTRMEQGSQVFLQATVRDISERKIIENSLLESRERFKDISHSIADWIWEVDQNGKYTFCSGKIETTLGYSPEEIIGKTPFELMAADEVERVAGIFQELAAAKKPIVDLENWNLNKDGTRVCINTNGVPILAEDGTLLGYRGVDKDITARIIIETEREILIAKLQKALAEIKTLQGIIPICMYCHKIKAELGDWNKLEIYFEEHTDADFTHGICPDCYEKQLVEVKKIKGD